MIGRTKCSTAVSSTVVSSTVAHQQQHRAHPYSQQQHRAHAAFSLLLQLCRPCTTWYNASTWPSRGSFPVNSFIWQDSFSFRCRSHLFIPILANSSTTDLSTCSGYLRQDRHFCNFQPRRLRISDHLSSLR